jgi:uncharacterized protein YecT (DUF1311 family)
MLTTLLLLLLSLTTTIPAQRQDPSTIPTPSVTPPPPQAANAPGKPEPCPDATSQLDLNECYSKLYQSADTELNATYNNIVGFMKKNLLVAQHDNNTTLVTHNEASLTKLLAAQRAWLVYRDANCDSVKFQYDGGSIQPMIWSECMADTTRQRITTLSKAYDTGD